MLRAERKKAFEKLLAFLPTGYGKNLSVQLLALLAKRAGNYASYRRPFKYIYLSFCDMLLLN